MGDRANSSFATGDVITVIRTQERAAQMWQQGGGEKLRRRLRSVQQ